MPGAVRFVRSSLRFFLRSRHASARSAPRVGRDRWDRDRAQCFDEGVQWRIAEIGEDGLLIGSPRATDAIDGRPDAVGPPKSPPQCRAVRRFPHVTTDAPHAARTHGGALATTPRARDARVGGRNDRLRRRPGTGNMPTLSAYTICARFVRRLCMRLDGWPAREPSPNCPRFVVAQQLRQIDEDVVHDVLGVLHGSREPVRGGKQIGRVPTITGPERRTLTTPQGVEVRRRVTESGLWSQQGHAQGVTGGGRHSMHHVQESLRGR